MKADQIEHYETRLKDMELSIEGYKRILQLQSAVVGKLTSMGFWARLRFAFSGKIA